MSDNTAKPPVLLEMQYLLPILISCAQPSTKACQGVAVWKAGQGISPYRPQWVMCKHSG